jgi:hypothetical protein
VCLLLLMSLCLLLCCCCCAAAAAGIGKTVEVFALILAHPPPHGILGKRALEHPAAAANESNAATSLEGDGCDSDDSYDNCPLFMRAGEAAAAKRRRLAATGGSQQQQQQQQLQQPAAAGSSGSSGWPHAGKWAGATLVVTPPAILQQWVAEANKRTNGLK